ncbi:MAG: hypothetical protein HC869_09095, partial [Rhodospirillales bacterium]|nr:hypothetical protein [Rhodospirillales bacterium]
EQQFGSPGQSQRWINILGNVPAAEVSTLSYSLNGGAFRPLSIGADGRRLERPGDFNVEIDFAELDGSNVDDVVTIRAQMTSGLIVTRDVVVNYEDSYSWPKNYDIDWGGVTDLQDVVAVVDGAWSHDAVGVRPTIVGYDRLLVLGDGSWDNYEATMTVTTHDLTVSTRQSPGFAFGMLWNGHTDDPVSGFQPHAGWEPGAAFFYKTNNGSPVLDLHEYHNFDKVRSLPFNLAEGNTYEVKIRVEQADIFDRVYKIKIWAEGTAEPTDWLIEYTDRFSEPVTGSLYLNAHRVDVSFGDISVREIPGHDIVPGSGAPRFWSRSTCRVPILAGASATSWSAAGARTYLCSATRPASSTTMTWRLPMAGPITP